MFVNIMAEKKLPKLGAMPDVMAVAMADVCSFTTREIEIRHWGSSRLKPVPPMNSPTITHGMLLAVLRMNMSAKRARKPRTVVKSPSFRDSRLNTSPKTAPPSIRMAVVYPDTEEFPRFRDARCVEILAPMTL